jgi:hypothetical protein
MASHGALISSAPDVELAHGDIKRYTKLKAIAISIFFTLTVQSVPPLFSPRTKSFRKNLEG